MSETSNHYKVMEALGRIENNVSGVRELCWFVAAFGLFGALLMAIALT